jgi:hypothetical protein
MPAGPGPAAPSPAGLRPGRRSPGIPGRRSAPPCRPGRLADPSRPGLPRCTARHTAAQHPGRSGAPTCATARCPGATRAVDRKGRRGRPGRRGLTTPPEGRWRAASTAAPTRTVNTECPSPHVLSGVRVWCRMGEPKADPARDLHLRTPAGCHTPPSPTINNVVSGRPRDVRQRPPECSGSGTIAGSPARRPADPQRHFSACD